MRNVENTRLQLMFSTFPSRFSNAHRVLSQCNTRLGLLYLLNKVTSPKIWRSCLIMLIGVLLHCNFNRVSSWYCVLILFPNIELSVIFTANESHDGELLSCHFRITAQS